MHQPSQSANRVLHFSLLEAPILKHHIFWKFLQQKSLFPWAYSNFSFIAWHLNEVLRLFHCTLLTSSLVFLLTAAQEKVLGIQSLNFYFHELFFLLSTSFHRFQLAALFLQLAIFLFFNKGMVSVQITKHSCNDNVVFLMPFLTWVEGERVKNIFLAKPNS